MTQIFPLGHPVIFLGHASRQGGLCERNS